MSRAKNVVPLIPGTPAARRRERPLVFIWLGPGLVQVEQRVLELARERGWRIIDARWCDWTVPPGLKPAGVIAETLALLEVGPQIRKLGCPVVRVGLLPHPQDWRVPAVLPDLAAAGRLAAEHFAERRFRHVGYACYSLDGDYQPMYESFAARAAELDCECHRLVYRNLRADKVSPTGPRKQDLRDREFAEWLRRMPKPIGLLTFGDSPAARMCVQCQRVGIKVPAEVALLGYGNESRICDCTPVTLSSVDPAMEHHADVAVRLLQDLMDGKPGPKKAVCLPPTRIVARESTDVLASRDAVVAQAVRHLWDHLDLDLSVDDVARAVGVSRRRLERSFRVHLGCGVNAELRRKRLEVFRELLTSTDRPIVDLAPMVGFRTLVHLQRSFIRAYGMTAREYRKKAERGIRKR